MLIKCMRARGLIVIVESKNGSIATLQPLKHVLRNPMWLIGDKDAGKFAFESSGSDVSQLSETAD